MSDLRSLLTSQVKAVEASQDALEKTFVKVRRRQRNRGLAARALGLGLTVALVMGLWLTWGVPGRRIAVGPVSQQEWAMIQGQFIDAQVDGSMWVLTCERGCFGEGRDSTGSLQRIDLATGENQEAVSVSSPQALALGQEGLWVVSFWENLLTRIDPSSGDALGNVALTLPFEITAGDRQFAPIDVAAGQGAAWVLTARGVVARIDPNSSEVLAMITIPPAVAGEIAAGEDAVWVSAALRGVLRIDPSTNQTSAEIAIQEGARRLSIEQIVTGGGAVWGWGVWAERELDVVGQEQYVSTEEGAVVKIDPLTNRVVATTPVPSAGDLMFGEGAVWFAPLDQGRLLKLDPDGRRVAQSFSAPVGGRFIAVGGGALWILQPDGTLLRRDLGGG